jgi:hypothetical protein
MRGREKTLISSTARDPFGLSVDETAASAGPDVEGADDPSALPHPLRDAIDAVASKIGIEPHGALGSSQGTASECTCGKGGAAPRRHSRRRELFLKRPKNQMRNEELVAVAIGVALGISASETNDVPARNI